MSERIPDELRMSDWPAHERATIAAQRAAHDPVEHPAHYTRGGIECIDVIEALGLGFHVGNALKYIWRAGHKDFDGLEDLEKARWYIAREIDRRRRPA